MALAEAEVASAESKAKADDVVTKAVEVVTKAVETPKDGATAEGDGGAFTAISGWARLLSWWQTTDEAEQAKAQREMESERQRQMRKTESGHLDTLKAEAAAVVKAQQKGDSWLADRVYSGVPASWLGRSQEIEVGPLSGSSNVVYFLRTRGLREDPEVVDAVLLAAKESNRVLTEQEVLAIVEQTGAGQ